MERVVAYYVQLLRPYLVVFAAAMFLAYVITPIVRRFSFRIRAVDLPDERKVHERTVARLGGIAIYLSFVLGLGGDLAWRYLSRPGHFYFEVSIWPILAGGTIVLITGIADDIWGLSPGVKFGGQLLAAGTLVAGPLLLSPDGGTRLFLVEFVGNPFTGDIINLAMWVAIPATVFWVVLLINTVNFIDGLDGLAAGVVGIALISLSYAAYMTGRTDVALVTMALAGSSLGFLKHNFYPARIFMGDSGSMFLGFVLGAITVEGVMKSVAAIALLIPIVLLGIPILDTVFAVWRRMKGGQPVSQADREHIHHRLLTRGLTHRQTVVIIYLWSFLLSFSALALKFGSSSERVFILVPLAILSFFLAEYSGVFEWLRARTRR